MNESTSFENVDLNDAGTIEKKCWDMLSDAVHDRTHPMRTMVIGTVAGSIAQLRTIVLRKVERDTCKIYFHTDIRSTKIEEIRASGQLSWLAYDATRRTQLRLSGPTELHQGNAIARAQWDKTQHSSRRCYLLAEGPGRKVNQDNIAEDELLSRFSYSMEESEAGFNNFAVVETTVDMMEWYYTHHRGNKRIQFSYQLGMLKDTIRLTP